MLSVVSPIVPLSSKIVEQLQRFDDFYVCTKFTEDMIGPTVARIDNNIYYRFMKFIYLPQPPEKLYPEQVIDVCNLRISYLSELVDYKLNTKLVNTMAKYALSTSTHVISKLNVLDFGCGSGLSSQLLSRCISNSEIVGVDISEKAVFNSRKQAITAFYTFPGGSLPFNSATFDLIFAVFVMHFNLDIPTLIELRRVLRPLGQFVFNFRERNKCEIIEQSGIRTVDRIIHQLEEAGFCSFKVVNHIEGISPNHNIISCRSLPLHETVFYGSMTEPHKVGI
jgi:SAM-dependent methyltransferase